MKSHDQYEDGDRDTEITLGTRSILGIFFALALVCGVFFGFGYSIGRGNTNKAITPDQPTASPPGTAQPAVKTVVEPSGPRSDLPSNDDADIADSTDQTPQRPSKTALTKPSAGSASVPPTALQARTATEDVNPPNQTIAQTPAQIRTPQFAPSVPMLQKTVLPAYPSQVAGVAGASPAIMVQIAAVSRREDADVLISALKKLGYNANVNSETSDNLLHVQVGPFATRDQANTMRTKLLNDGYNAILK